MEWSREWALELPDEWAPWVSWVPCHPSSLSWNPSSPCPCPCLYLYLYPCLCHRNRNRNRNHSLRSSIHLCLSEIMTIRDPQYVRTKNTTRSITTERKPTYSSLSISKPGRGTTPEPNPIIHTFKFRAFFISQRFSSNQCFINRCFSSNQCFINQCFISMCFSSSLCSTFSLL